MIEEKIYVLDDYNELIIIEKIMYNGIPYMLLKNSKNDEIKIAFEHNSKLYYINQEDENYNVISSMLLEKIKQNLENI